MLLRTTLWLSTLSTVTAIPIGVFVAWLLVRTDVPLRKMWIALLFVPLCMPLYLHAAFWETAFGRLGWYTQLGVAGTRPLLSGFRGAYWVHSVAAVPWAALLAGAHLTISNRDLESAARLEASPLGVFRHVSIAEVAPAAVFAALWVFVWIAGEMTVTDIFGVRTYAEEVYIGFAIDTAGGEQAVTPSWTAGVLLVVALSLLAALVCQLALPRIDGHQQRPSALKLGSGRWVALGFVVFVALLLLFFPVGNLVYKSGLETVAGKSPSWSAEKVGKLVASAPVEYQSEFGWSLAAAQLASLLALVGAAPLAYASTRSRRIAAAAFVLTAICFALPGPIVAIALIRLFTFPSELVDWLYSRTILAPVIAMATKCFPLVMGMLWVGIRRTQPEMFETAQIAGASSWQQFTRIAIPTRLGVVIFAFLAGVIFNLGDLAASILVVPPGVTTLSIRIFGLIHYGVEDRLAALCLVVVGSYLLLAAIVAWAWSILREDY